ncbi:MAG TPA: DUF1707 domain-containing protein [Kribbella sp.]|nr:DUF1707 domain-containing protein [Kribbella sp.]
MSQHFPARIGPIRIGDAERDEAVAALSEHFVAGRLTQEEFEERSDQATRARYTDDLSPLFADLPDHAALQPGSRTRSPGFRPGPQRSRPGPPMFLWLAPVLMVGLVVATFSLAAPWILWVLFWIALFSRLDNRRRWHRSHRR